MMGGKDGYVTPNTSGGAGGGGRGAVTVQYAPVINIDSRTDRAEVTNLVARAVRSGQQELLDAISRRQA
jgi:hypothetical protein